MHAQSSITAQSQLRRLWSGRFNSAWEPSAAEDERCLYERTVTGELAQRMKAAFQAMIHLLVMP